jgi:hypothetical protein
VHSRLFLIAMRQSNAHVINMTRKKAYYLGFGSGPRSSNLTSPVRYPAPAGII